MFETTLGRVIIDYAHNAAAIGGLLDFLAELPATHRMAMIAVPGDRRDEDMREVARLASSLDYVIFKEHEAYRRGRPAGEGAQLMADALLATGFPSDRVAAFAEERVALAHALTLMRPGGVVAIMADDAKAVLEQLRPYMPQKDD
jgi:cyanophycin synthetase